MRLSVREPTEQRIIRSLTIISGLLTLFWTVVLILLLLLYPMDPTHAGSISTLDKALLLSSGLVATAANGISMWAQLPAKDSQTIEDAGDLTTTGDTAVIQLIPIRKPKLATVTAGITAMAVLVAAHRLTATAGGLGPEHAKLVNFSYFGTVLISVAGVVIVCTIANDLWRWMYLIFATVVRVPWALEILGNDPSGVRRSMAMGVITMGFVVAEIHYLRSVARNGDNFLRDTTRAVIDTASRASATAEASRIDGLVHDHILAALLLASRADDPEDAPFIRRSAASALAALSEISAPEADELNEKEVSAAVFAAQLAQKVHAEDPTITTTSRGKRPQPIPMEAATTLLAAAGEAVRNSLRHADGGSGRPVTRSVTVHATRDGVSVVIQDDGVGFDQSTATAGRYGVAGSILGRMQGIEGGSAKIQSAPGKGTVVRLFWSYPETAGSKRPTAPQQDTGDQHGTVEERYFAQLDANAMEDVPLGPTVRGMVAVFLGFAYFILETLDLFDPIWVSPLAALVFVVGFVLTVLPWLSDPLADPGRVAMVIMALLCPITLALTLWAWNVSLPIHTNLWTVTLMYLVIVFLGFNNYPRAAWVAAFASVIVIVAWASLCENASTPAPEMIVFMLVAPFIGNGIQKTAFTMMTKSAAIANKQRLEADLRARELAAAAARRKRGNRVDSLARPLLERFAAGERTIAAARTEAAQLEAHLRDDLRARCFRDTDVTRAANDARRAGVRVELMDDGGLTNASDTLREEVIEAAVTALDRTDSGSVIVRVAPPDRDVVATILTETGSGAEAKTRRLEIHAPLATGLTGAS